ncbi:hypothetical protein I7I50_00291 [Histoplasma capsulatum G186AR]|uniref:Uncharacterized protein n=1 Tax=Ajellomyces capsulatus TaxID=5037 RepID=A0A8H7YID7_AJECA|nr:hypothetical protein I7I52_07559 [Histoplasma capsulatum]QSS72441.1 hypothetical protein I7I50_00291 [Histoplasma capsulatum G186AR]
MMQISLDACILSVALKVPHPTLPPWLRMQGAYKTSTTVPFRHKTGIRSVILTNLSTLPIEDSNSAHICPCPSACSF